MGRNPADVAFLYGHFECAKQCASGSNYKLEYADCVICFQEAKEVVDHFGKYEKIYTTRSDFNEGVPGSHLVTNVEMESIVAFEDIEVHNVPR